MSDTIPSGILTEAGIALENGETIATGKIVEIAQRGKVLYESGDYASFEDLMYGEEVNGLDDSQQRLLMNTMIIDRPLGNVLWLLADIEYDRYDGDHILDADVDK